MKKWVLLLILTATMFLVCGCGNNAQPENGVNNQENLQGNDTESGTGTESETVQKEPSASAPSVYMATDISPEGLGAVYEALEAAPSGNVAVKLSTGEPDSNYLQTDLIGDLVQSLMASSEGKSWIHSGGTRTSGWSGNQDAFLEYKLVSIDD